MSDPPPLIDCAKKGPDGNSWFVYNDDANHKSSYPNNVGFITECKDPTGTDPCGEGDVNYKGYYSDGGPFKKVGILKNIGMIGDRDMYFVDNQGKKGPKCPKINGEDVGGCYRGGTTVVCQRTDYDKGNKWKDCCQKNKKDSPKGGCLPLWYGKGDDKYSDECREVCMGNSKYKSSTPEDTLKNENKLCLDILEENKPSGEELRKFCRSPIAYKDGQPVEEYTNICGCYYDDSYYTKLKEALKERFPKVPGAFLDSPECYADLCTNSKLKDKTMQCRPSMFQTCIINSSFNASSVSMKDESSIKFKTTNECKQIYNQYNHGNLPPPPPPGPEPPGPPGPEPPGPPSPSPPPSPSSGSGIKNQLSTILNQNMYDPNIKNFYNQKWFLISIIVIIIISIVILVGLILYSINNNKQNSN